MIIVKLLPTLSFSLCVINIRVSEPDRKTVNPSFYEN